MSWRAPFETAGDSDEFTRNYRCRSRLRKSFQFQRRDRVHDALTQSCVKILVARLKVSLGKINWFAHHDRNGMKMKTAAAWKRLVRAENPDGHDRRERSGDNQSHARLGRLQISI